MEKHNHINKYFIAVIFLVLGFLSFVIVQGFLLPIFIGALVAYTVYPGYVWLIKRIKSERQSAVIISMAAIIVFCLIVILIVPDLIIQVNELWRVVFSDLLGKLDQLKECSTDENDLFCVASNYALSSIKGEELISKNALSFLENALNLILFITIVLLSAVYFLHNGKRLVGTAIEKAPLKDSNKKKAVARIDEVLKAVIFGNIVTAFIEGVLVAIFFLVLGIPFAFVAGMLVMFFALIPPLGAAIVWGLAVVVLIVLGEYFKALVLFILCIAILGYIDNLARPAFIGKKVRLSAFWILLGVLGGLGTFGFAGIIIGPLVLALFVTSVEILLDEIAEERKEQKNKPE